MFTKKGDAAVLAKLGDAPAQFREIGERAGLERDAIYLLRPDG